MQHLSVVLHVFWESVTVKNELANITEVSSISIKNDFTNISLASIKKLVHVTQASLGKTKTAVRIHKGELVTLNMRLLLIFTENAEYYKIPHNDTKHKLKK